MASIRGD